VTQQTIHVGNATVRETNRPLIAVRQPGTVPVKASARCKLNSEPTRLMARVVVGPHVANDSVLDVTAGARSAAVIRHTPARGSLDAVDRADTRGECLNTRAGVE
jgi:hypothetical protein